MASMVEVTRSQKGGKEPAFAVRVTTDGTFAFRLEAGSARGAPPAIVEEVVSSNGPAAYTIEDARYVKVKAVRRAGVPSDRAFDFTWTEDARPPVMLLFQRGVTEGLAGDISG